MAQTATRLNTQSYPISPPSTNMNNLNQIIVFDPILSDYFKNKSSPPQYWRLAYELMLDGLRYRATNQTNIRNCCCNQQKSSSPVKQTHNTQNIKPILKENKNQRNTGQSPGEQKRMKTHSGQKDKHYNVSYVKHQRFLSPSQRKQLITPKVTQVIPAATAPLLIYGKPRVKIDQQCGCPYHSNQQECLRSIPYGETCQPRQMPVRVVHVKQPAGLNRNLNSGYESVHPEAEAYQNNLTRYNSTPNLNKNSKYVKEANQEVLNLQRTKKLQNQSKKVNNFEATNSQFKKQKSKSKTIQADQRVPEQRTGNVVYVDRIVQVQSRVPGQMKIIKSPKSKIIHEQYSLSDEQSSYLDARYGNQSRNKKSGSKQVESKIKFLIERDKRNKEMQKNLKKQQEQIKILQKMIKQDRTGVDMKRTKVVNENNYGSSASPPFQISNTLRQSLSLSSSQSSEMSMLDSQIVKKYRSNANKGNRAAKKEQQQVGYFGVADKQNEIDQQCSCENSYNDDEMSESEQRQIKIKQSRSSNEDNDSISEYQP